MSRKNRKKARQNRHRAQVQPQPLTPQVQYAYKFPSNGKRKNHGSDPQPLAEAMDMTGRRTANVLARDLYKESDIFRWAVDFQCNNLMSFAFQPTSSDDGLNRALQDFYDYFNHTADIAGRYTFEQLWDLWEHRRLIDGDVLIVRLDSGELQTIQSNWIVESGEKSCVQGVYLNNYGRALGYHVERTASDGSTIEDDIPACYADLFAYYDYEVDSYRGVSPLISSLERFQDLNEVLEAMTSKIKLEAHLGLGIKKNNAALGFRGVPQQPENSNPNSEGTIDSTGEFHPTKPPTQKIKLDEGVSILQLDSRDDIVNFTPTTPTSTFEQFFLMAVQSGLKPTGIPLTIYQENMSNYYSSRAAYGCYQYHIKDAVYYNQKFLSKLFVWRLAVGIRNGEISLPHGMLAKDAPFRFMYEQHSVLDEDRESKGSQLQVAIGASTPQREAAKRGYSFYDNVDEIARAMQYANDKGVTIAGLNDKDERSTTNKEGREDGE